MAATGVLDGIRVLDLTTVIMGPLATQVLGDLGADVIKVETGTGDGIRSTGGGGDAELSGMALNLLRNKRAVTLDLKHPDGLAALHRILATCDVFVTNLRPAPLRRLGLDYAEIGPAHPRLVYGQAQGYRIGSGHEDLPAYDDIIQAAAGFPRLNEAMNGTPSFMPAAVVDKIAGQTLLAAVLAALFHRERTGRGQRVEIPMFDAAMAINLVEHLARATTHDGPAGYSRVLATTRGPQRTTDGHVVVLPYTDEHWRRFLTAVGREDLLEDPCFADVRQRTTHAERVGAELQAIVGARSTAHWIELCRTEGIPASRVPTLDEILGDAELHHDVVSTMTHPHVGEYLVIGPGMILDDAPLQVRRPAPMRSEHTAEVLAEVGYRDDEIAALVASGAVEVRPL